MNWPATILLVFIESLLIANHLKTIRDPGSLKRLAQAVGQKDAIEDNCGRFCFSNVSIKGEWIIGNAIS